MKQSLEAALTRAQEGDAVIVTPTNPLIINQDPANFGPVQIAGGDITVQVKTTVTFASLEKTS